MRLTGSGNTARMYDPKRQERNDTKATGQENTKDAGGYGGYTEDEIWDNIVHYEAEQKQKAGTTPGAVAGAMAGAAGASVARNTATKQSPTGVTAGAMAGASVAKNATTANKQVQPSPAAVTDQIKQNTKTLTQMYMEYKDSPLVEEYYQILKAQEADGEKGKNDELDEALGEAMYKSYARYSPDKATEAARKAQANAYDSARRAAGGAGTSYAATAGAKAYSDAYESYKDQEADREMEAFETALNAYDGTNGETIREWLNITGLDQQSVDRIMTSITGDYEKAQTVSDEEEKQALLSDFMGTMLMAYDGTNEAGLRQLAAYEGITDEDFDLMLAAVEKDRETSTESSLSDEADSIYAYLTGTDEEGNPNYTGEFRNTTKQDLLNRDYSEEAIDEALDRYENTESEYYEDVGNILTEALKSGMTDKVYEEVGFTAEKWAEKDENERGEIILEAMGKMVKTGKMDSSVFAEQALSAAMENVDDILEEYKGRNWWEKTWDFLTSTEREEVLVEVARCVVTLKGYKDSGYMTDDQYQHILEQIAREGDIANMVQDKDKELNDLVTMKRNVYKAVSKGLVGIGGAIQKSANWNTQRKDALNDLLGVIEGK